MNPPYTATTPRYKYSYLYDIYGIIFTLVGANKYAIKSAKKPLGESG